MTGHKLSEDRRFCRAILPEVSRTFALSIRMLAGSFRDSVATGYLLCRTADTLEDSLGGDGNRIRDRFARLQEALDGNQDAADALAREASATRRGADVVLVSELPRVLRVYQTLPADDRAALRDCLGTMCEGMARYSSRAADRAPGAPYLDREGELHDYCWVVAGCVGVMLTRLYSRRSPARSAAEEARRYELAPVVGEALQLTNIFLDWPSDVRRGRCYVPASWLEEFGLRTSDLVDIEHSGTRELAARLEHLARAALARVPEYVALLPRRSLRYRLFVLCPALWALRSIEHARRDPEFPWGPRRPRLPRTELWQTALAALWSGDSRIVLRPASTA